MTVHSRPHGPERQAFGSTGVHSCAQQSTANGSQLGSQHDMLHVEVLAANDVTAFVLGTRRTEGLGPP